jgi:hypothetical protein
MFKGLKPQSRKQIWSIILGLLSVACMVLAIAFPRIPAMAQISQAVVQEILDGDEVFVQDAKATLNQIAKFNEVVRTEKSRTALVFANLTAGRLAPNSSVSIGQCVEVREGQLIASGPVNGCIAGFNVGVQGTIFVMDADDGGKFQVLEGDIKVSKGSEETVEVTQGQQVAIEDGKLGEVKRISLEDFVKILKGALFEGFTVPLPNQEKLIQICNDLRQDALGGGTEGQIIDRVLGVPECPTELGVRVRPPIRLPF